MPIYDVSDNCKSKIYVGGKDKVQCDRTKHKDNVHVVTYHLLLQTKHGTKWIDGTITWSEPNE